MKIFLICGYGIPADIHKDTNYQTYLHILFNHIFERARKKQAVIIPSGGPTNCKPPYLGTEAACIRDYLTELMTKPTLKTYTSLWKILPETQSLSTLENILFTKRLLTQKHLQGTLTIFCEKTRARRVRMFAQHIFQNQRIIVQPIDFDISQNRYLDPRLLRQKEQRAIQEGLWTLEKPQRLKRHHTLFEKKFLFLRKRQSEGLSHVDAVKEWLENEKDILHQLMPDHPILKGGI